MPIKFPWIWSLLTHSFLLFFQTHLEEIHSRKTIPSKAPHLRISLGRQIGKTRSGLQTLLAGNPLHQPRYHPPQTPLPSPSPTNTGNWIAFFSITHRHLTLCHVPSGTYSPAFTEIPVRQNHLPTRWCFQWRGRFHTVS